MALRSRSNYAHDDVITMDEPVTQDQVVFMSYARPDRSRVEPFCRYLRDNGLDVWVDYEQIRPGQDWDHEIKRGLSQADFIVVFVSNKSVDRRGYVQRELSGGASQRPT